MLAPRTAFDERYIEVAPVIHKRFFNDHTARELKTHSNFRGAHCHNGSPANHVHQTILTLTGQGPVQITRILIGAVRAGLHSLGHFKL